MAASQILSAHCRQLAMLEAKLAKLEAKEKGLYVNEGGTALSVLNAAIQKCKEGKINVHYEYQEQLKKLSMDTQYEISYNAEFLMSCLLNLQAQYYYIIEWLCKRLFVDQNGEQKTGWAQFRNDDPHYNIWTYDD